MEIIVPAGDINYDNAEQKKMEDKEVNKSTTVRRSPRLATIANQSLMLLTLLALMATTATAQKTTTLQQESIVPTVLRDAWEHREFTFWDGINNIFFMSAVFATCYLLTICLATINGIGTVIRCVIKVFRGIIQGLQFIWTTVTSMRKTRLEKASIITLLLLGIISTVIGCNEIASIKADEKVCVLNEDRTACYLNTVSILNVRPNGSIGCYRIDKLLEKSRLPTVESGITVNTEKGQVITKLTTSALVAIQLQFRNQSVHRIVHNDTCTVQDVNLEGCYSCGEGAQLSATCFSVMNNRIEATVRCPTTGVDFLECTKEGQRGVLTFQSAAKMIEEKCTVQCGTSVQEFAVKGESEEEVTFNADLVKEKFAEFTEFISTDNFLNNIGEVIMAPYNKVVNFLGSTALIGLMLLAAIIGLQCYLGSFGIGGFGGSSCLPECRRKRYKRRRYRG
ncbi:hypothetical protein L5515_019571 [Caenorhabditis briggsae]|uniref:Phlebovirus glycoprotein G2 fusion domain-containing protein n=1 Tax=Caenorhabditis briggsae TaxID=6238 RepID=A0AAE9FPQ7_CAEBR|nr:hypothetical protein L5515_019571 [Caenorhabditis briggsae]